MISANPFSILDEYELRHLGEHLEMAKRPDDLHRVLWLEWAPEQEVSVPQSSMHGWLEHFIRRDQAKPQSPRRNAWYEIREERGDIEGYLADVERAWQLSENGSAIEQSDERPVKAVGLQCGYALFRASIGRLALNIPANLLAALVKQKIWSQTQGVVYAELLPEEERRAKALAALAPYLQEPLIWRAITDAHLITDARPRVQALLADIPFVPVTERTALLTEVLNIIRILGNEEQWDTPYFKIGSTQLSWLFYLIFRSKSARLCCPKHWRSFGQRQYMGIIMKTRLLHLPLIS